MNATAQHPTPSTALRVEEYGDAGLLVTFDSSDAEERWSAARSLQVALREPMLPGTGEVVDVVAAFETVYVSFDPLRTDHAAVRALIAELSTRAQADPEPAVFRVPAVYGGQRGPDLDDVAAELGLSPAELVELHTSQPWTVRFRGSPVAAPMMDGPTMPASVARSAVPRTQVPPGSVAISGQQCLVYPVLSPGGWRLIGQTPVQLFDLAHAELVAYRPGDQLQFFAVSDQAWDDWAGRPLESGDPR